LGHKAQSRRGWRRGSHSFTLLIYAPTSLAILITGVLWRSREPWSAGMASLCAVGAAGLWTLGRTALTEREEGSGSITRPLALGFLSLFVTEAVGETLSTHVLHLGGSTVVLWRGVWVQWAVTLCVLAAMPRLRSVILKNEEREHERFLAAAENTLDDFYIFDGVADKTGQIVDFRFNYVNPNAERRLGRSREELKGKILTEVRPFMIRSGLIEKYREVVRTGVPYTCEVFLDDEMIRSTWLNVQVVKLGNGIAITSRDVTERKRLTDHVNYLAHHDSLTGLPNRALLLESLHKAIVAAAADPHPLAVFMVDVDFFKRINDTLGHASGDTVLAAVGARLRAAVRDSDLVARLGGDEFVVVLPSVRGMEDVRLCGRKLIENASRPVDVGGKKIEITLSVGVSLFPEHGNTPNELLHAADAAMYRMKDTGRNGMRMFKPEDLERGMELSAGEGAIFGSSAWSRQRWERPEMEDRGRTQVEGLED
jgi:diguanylate cyclase (GGDEF)-like protein